MQNQLLKFIIALATLILTLFSFSYAQSEQDAYRTEIFKTSSSPEVNISTSGGFVRVYGHNEDEVKVVMYVRRNNQYLSSSDTDLSDFEIEIHKSGDSVYASAKRENSGFTGFFSGRNNISVSFEVFVPEESKVDGSTSGGSVRAENIRNDVRLRTSGGSVTANEIHGNSDLRTSGGSITLDSVTGLISARTSGGSIRADGLIGEADLRTSGGSIRIDNINAKLSARTSGGSIRAKFTQFEHDIDLRTSGGSIQIEIPSTEHFDIDLTGSRVNTELRNFTGSSERNKIVGRIGDGGPKISARTSGGTVGLRYN